MLVPLEKKIFQKTVSFTVLKSDYLHSFLRGMFEGVPPMKAHQTQTSFLNKAAEKGQSEGTLFSLQASVFFVIFFASANIFYPMTQSKDNFSKVMLALACWFCCFVVFFLTSEATAAGEQRIKSKTACFFSSGDVHVGPCLDGGGKKAAVSFSFPSLHLRRPISSSHLSPSLLLRSDSADGERPLHVPPSVQTSPSAPSNPPPSPPPSLLHPWLTLPRDDVCLRNGQRETRRKRIRRTRSGVLKVSSAAELLCPDTWTRPPQVGCEISVAACFFRPQMQNKSIVSQEIRRWALTGKSTDSPRLQI